ncbi:putative Late nodulin [Medicago truncatula]|uniref:Nodule Cysteine-Rich (NCR) secreted peptide n=1 Tax=Medicago truncatula TaxID=3880 RepID=G7KV47_MEDTR|nr:Nodule Cysteine-Rich (NCR) secreted peptide [Medicago truncatula]AFK37694.1 unknown [Medicago truncatula]RHN46610.1 putative Late nodulin [Medicago truncatula]
MASILKFVYIMIIYLSVLLVVIEGYPFQECKVDADCPTVCTLPGCPDICSFPDVPTCIDNNCFCT